MDQYLGSPVWIYYFLLQSSLIHTIPFHWACLAPYHLPSQALLSIFSCEPSTVQGASIFISCGEAKIEANRKLPLYCPFVTKCMWTIQAWLWTECEWHCSSSSDHVLCRMSQSHDFPLSFSFLICFISCFFFFKMTLNCLITSLLAHKTSITPWPLVVHVSASTHQFLMSFLKWVHKLETRRQNEACLHFSFRL